MNDDTTRRLPAYLLAGGRSRRLGRDKARAALDDETTVIEAVAASIEDAVSSVTAVADRRAKYDDLGIRTIADFDPHLGPLGGILRAADDAGEGYFLIRSCDRIGLRATWVRILFEETTGRPPAVCFRFQDRLEPLFALYRAELADALQHHIDQGMRAVWRFLRAVDVRSIDAPDGWHKTLSINTAEQLDRARQMIE